MRGRGAYRVLYGDCVALPEERPEYTPLVFIDLSTLRDACIEQARRALELCRVCGVPIPEAKK